MKKMLVTIPAGDIQSTFIPSKVRDFLCANFDVTWNETTEDWKAGELRERLLDTDAVLTGWGTDMMNRAVLDGNERLKLIVHTGGSVGNLVDQYVYQNGIHVFSANKLYAESVAEGTIAYMLMAQRRMFDFAERVKNGQWRSNAAVWEGLLDKTVGIVDVGTIAMHLVRMLQPFRVKIKIFSRFPIPEEMMIRYHCEQADMNEIFKECDIVTVHAALCDATRHMVGKEQFDLLKDNALFVNTSRGEIIDEQALIEALKENRFRAVLDVYCTEPLAQDSPLRSLPNVISMPHMAGPTLDRRENITLSLLKEAVAFFEGQKESYLEISASYAARMTKE